MSCWSIYNLQLRFGLVSDEWMFHLHLYLLGTIVTIQRSVRMPFFDDGNDNDDDDDDDEKNPNWQTNWYLISISRGYFRVWSSVRSIWRFHTRCHFGCQPAWIWSRRWWRCWRWIVSMRLTGESRWEVGIKVGIKVGIGIKGRKNGNIY